MSGSTPDGPPLIVTRDDRGVVTVTLNRPEVRNAFNADLIVGLRDTFVALGDDEDARVVVLTGAGDVFCAGADLAWMSGMVDASMDDTRADSHVFESMLRAVDGCPRPVVGRINGHALGGGTGLVGCCDIVVSVTGASFGFTEVRLGIAPAVISPYVVPKIGYSQSRRFMLTGERFTATEAQDLGLVHHVTDADGLDPLVDGVVAALLAGAPNAQNEIKRLVRRVFAAGDPAEVADETVDLISRLRVSDEGQDGMRAFFEKRPPKWKRG